MYNSESNEYDKYNSIITSDDYTFGYLSCTNSDGNIIVIGNEKTDTRVGILKVYNVIYPKNVNTENIIIRQKGTDIVYTQRPLTYGKTTSITINNEGTRITIGIPKESMENRGNVLTYQWNGTNWVLMDNIIKGENNTNIGQIVKVSQDGNVLYIATPESFFNSGNIKRYEWNRSGGNWEEQPDLELYGDYNNDYVGLLTSISEDANTIMIGTPGYTIGRIQILTMNSGFWVQKGEIIQYRNDALKPEWGDFKTILVEQGVDVSTNFLSSQDEVIRITQANQLYLIQRIEKTIDENEAIKKGYVLEDITGAYVYITKAIYNSELFPWREILNVTDVNKMGEVFQKYGNFGSGLFSISLNGDGNIFAVGRPLSNITGNESGMVDIYEWNEENSMWRRKGLRLLGKMNENFGKDIKINDSGDILVIETRDRYITYLWTFNRWKEIEDIPKQDDIYTTITKKEIDTSIIDVNNIDISVDIKTGNNPSSDGILMLGTDTTCGNLYIWIGSGGTINFGVQCNGNGSDSPLYSGNSTIDPNTEYKIRVKYNGTLAQLWINENYYSENKTFNFNASFEYLKIGNGSVNDNTTDTYDFTGDAYIKNVSIKNSFKLPYSGFHINNIGNRLLLNFDNYINKRVNIFEYEIGSAALVVDDDVYNFPIYIKNSTLIYSTPEIPFLTGSVHKVYFIIDYRGSTDSGWKLWWGADRNEGQYVLDSSNHALTDSQRFGSGDVNIDGVNIWNQYFNMKKDKLAFYIENDILNTLISKDRGSNLNIDTFDTGENHTILLKDDDVYVTGINNDGELGVLDFNNRYLFEKVKVYNWSELKIKTMKSGEDFYIMLDMNGMLYSFGNKNDMGQLGHNNLKPGKDVKKIDFDKKVVDFDIGLNHIILLTDDKKVYSFGDNRNGQLGLDSILEYSLTPKLIDLSFNGLYANIKDIECIDNETYLVDNSDNVYYCGNGILKPEKLDDQHNYVLIKKNKNKRFYNSRGNEEYYLDLCGNFTYKKIYDEPFYFKDTEHIDTNNNNQLETEKMLKMIGKPVVTNDQKTFGSIYDYDNNRIVR